jgi:[1-hydroxy-2-(trimethylamino)ethyl]phosphonate dioxygenase
LPPGDSPCQPLPRQVKEVDAVTSPSVVSDVTALLELYEAGGDRTYGEQVTLRSHSLQCAGLARAAGAGDALVASALLHDVGHLVVDEGVVDRDRPDEDDDHHEAVGGRMLAAIFSAEVARPVALHVQAKRWRCTVEPAYLETLSALSTATLEAQGGLLDLEECGRFEAHPGFADAVALRGWDDEAKVIDLAVPRLGEYRDLLDSLARSGRTQHS